METVKFNFSLGTTLVFLVFAGFVSADETSNSTKSGPKPFRLPSNVIPQHYKLEVLHILDEVVIISNSTTFNHTRFTSPGKVWIRVDVTQPTRNITLHAEEIEIGNVEISKLNLGNSSKSRAILVSNKTLDAEVQFLILHLQEDLPVGEYEIYIEFTARIADDRLNGLYLDYYTDPRTKEKRYLATTLFAPHHARKAFPCFDEPALRATFDITIGHLKDKYTSLSNNKQVSSKPINDMPGWVWDTFGRTPSMSTYIVAMITSDFVSVDATTEAGDDQTKGQISSNPVQLKIFLPEFLRDYSVTPLSYRFKDKKTNETSVDFALQLLSEFSKGISRIGGAYPLDKLYSIALPHFYFSAMENWGMMTFKYPIILTVPHLATMAEKTRVREVVIHEMAHQVFGNLVGIDWWSHVWLKEGFATFYSQVGWPTVLNSSWIHEDPQVAPPIAYFASKMRQQALNFDEGLDTHPLENEPKVSAEIAGIYTKIPYDKGGSVIRMMFDFLQHPNSSFTEQDTSFTRGIQLYVKRMSYKSASQNDLFDAMQDGHEEYVNSTHPSSYPTLEVLKNVTIRDLIQSWTTQSGYPLVRVKFDEARGLLRFSQEKFINPHVQAVLDATKNETVKSNDTEESSWWIPLSFYPKTSCKGKENDELSSGAEATDKWIPQGTPEVTMDVKSDSIPLLINPTGSGFFRVLYDDPNLLSKLLAVLDKSSGGIPVSARSLLLDDYFSLAFAKYTPIETALDLTKFLKDENSFVVWQSLYRHLTRIYQMLRGNSKFEPFKEYVFSQIKSTVKENHFLFIGDSIPAQLVRSKALFHKIERQFDPYTCDQSDLKDYRIWKNLGPNPILADYQESTYCGLVSSASNCELKTNEVWEHFLALYTNEDFSVPKSRYLRALSCAREPEYLQRLLNWTVDPSLDLHDTDRVQIIQYIADNPVGHPLAFQFLSENFDSLFKNMSAANPVLEGMKTIVLYMNTPEDLAKLETFISNHTSSLGPKKASLEKLANQVKVNILWMEEGFGSRIAAWAADYNTVTKATHPTKEPNLEESLESLYSFHSFYHPSYQCVNHGSLYNRYGDAS